jgi:hypothetical protein
MAFGACGCYHRCGVVAASDDLFSFHRQPFSGEFLHFFRMRAAPRHLASAKFLRGPIDRSLPALVNRFFFRSVTHDDGNHI